MVVVKKKKNNNTTLNIIKSAMETLLQHSGTMKAFLEVEKHKVYHRLLQQKE